MQYKDWLPEWLELYIRPLKLRTYERYESICRLHVIPQLGDYELAEITPLLLQKYVNDLARQGNKKTGGELSPSFVNSVITVIQGSLKKANELGLVNVYYAGSVQRPKNKEGEVKCFTVREQKSIEAAVLASPKRKLFGIILALYTGLRIGELLALRFSDVDLQKRTITVAHSYHEGKDAQGKYGKIEEEPKTKSSCRVIPFPKQLLPIFKELKALSQSGYVIENGKGEQMSVRSYQRSFELLVKRLNIRPLSFHALRHTFATRALESGMDVKTLSEILGHKSATVTLNKYVHSMLEHKKSAMDKFGALFVK